MAELESQVSPLPAGWGTTGDPGEEEEAMSAPDSIRVTGERGETSLSRDAYGHQVPLWELCPRGGTRTFSLGAWQVRTLELERSQHKLLLESLQQRHKEDLDLLESAHRYQALAWAPLLCQVLAYSPVHLPWGGSAGLLPKSIPGAGRHRAVSMWTWWGQRAAPRVSQGGSPLSPTLSHG